MSDYKFDTPQAWAEIQVGGLVIDEHHLVRRLKEDYRKLGGSMADLQGRLDTVIIPPILKQFEGNYGGMSLWVDENLSPSELKYPTGYKDGNKLGKRKREMKVTKVYAFQRDILKSLDVPYDGRIIKKSWKRR